MRDHGRDASQQPADGLILEGVPPGSGRPSWLGLAIAVVIALAAGAALGYGVYGPTATPTPSAQSSSPALTASPAPTAFVASPCDLLAAVPYAQLSTFATSTIATNPSAVPGMRSCVVLDPTTMHRFAQVMLRQLPTSRTDFTVVADEVFQGDEVSPSSFGTTPGLLIPCSHFWPTCHPAAAFVQAPYFVIVALEPGVGDVSLVRSLATGLLGMGFAGGQPGPSPTAKAPPAIPIFTTPAPPGVDASWRGLFWQQLPEGDALASVAFTLRWSGGFEAVGRRPMASGATRTPVWFSSDGVLWRPLDASVFGDSTFIVGMASRAGTLVALSVQAGTNSCAPDGDCWSIRGPIQAWTSTNGTDWTGQPGLELALPANGDMPHLVAGPAGFLAVAPGPPDLASPTTAASSLDGVTWQTLPVGTFPAGFQLADLTATSAGYLAVGTHQADHDHHDATTLWATDGRHWSSASMQLAWGRGTALEATRPSSVALAVVAGRNGFIVTGGTGGAPGAALWWQSDDGQHWRQLSEYPPLAAWPGEGEGAGGQPYGVLLGDGQRIIALRGGPDAGAWSTTNGRTWTKLVIGGDMPSEQATTAALFPGGVVLSDGTTTWYGRATTGG